MDIAKIVKVYVCLIWMPQQMDLLLHMESTRILLYVHYGCLTE